MQKHKLQDIPKFCSNKLHFIQPDRKRKRTDKWQWKSSSWVAV